MKRILLMASLIAFGSAAVTPCRGVAVDDLESLQGTWNFVALEVEGARVPDAMLTGSKTIVKGDAFKSASGGIVYEATIKIDASKTPKTLDLIFTAGPEKGKTAPGVYELGGDDWKICLSLGASSRPTEFVAKQGSGHALETLRREKQ